MKFSTFIAFAPLAFGLTACGSAAYLHRPINTSYDPVIIRTHSPAPRTSGYFVVTTDIPTNRVDVSYPGGSVHHAPVLHDPQN